MVDKTVGTEHNLIRRDSVISSVYHGAPITNIDTRDIRAVGVLEPVGMNSIIPEHLLGERPAVRAARTGCANGGALTQQVLGYLLERHPDRFDYADCTNVSGVSIVVMVAPWRTRSKF